jgi:hypothetical protein
MKISDFSKPNYKVYPKIKRKLYKIVAFIVPPPIKEITFFLDAYGNYNYAVSDAYLVDGQIDRNLFRLKLEIDRNLFIPFYEIPNENL